jgi:hypothetical protein
MKKLVLITAALMALASPATALEVGTKIKFNTPRPIAVGCTKSKDAVEIAKLHRQRNEFAIQEFVNWLENSTDKDRACIILNNSPDNSWTIVKKEPGIIIAGRQQMTDGTWVCLQAQYDFRPASETNEPAPCLWIYLP